MYFPLLQINSSELNVILLAIIILLFFFIVVFLYNNSLADFVRSLRYPKLDYEEDLFWNSIIRWKWVKKDGHYVIDETRIEKICPRCQHNLITQKQGDIHFLFCESCRFISTEFYEGELKEPTADQQFKRVLKEEVSAELRKSGIYD